jgi:hypothetical protein
MCGAEPMRYMAGDLLAEAQKAYCFSQPVD